MDEEQKRARTCALACTLLYLALFFLSFYAIIFLPSLYGNPDMTTATGLLFIFLSLLPPLSIVVCLGIVWNRYFNGSYQSMYRALLIPFGTIITVVVLMKFIQLLFL